MLLSHPSIDRLTNVLTGLCGINPKGSKKEIDKIFLELELIDSSKTYNEFFKNYPKIINRAIRLTGLSIFSPYSAQK